MFRYWRGFVFLLLLAAVASPIQALPTATWWAVAHNQCDDTLHWISPSGEAVSIPRPRLPDEAPTPACMARSMHISRDGRYLVETGRLNNGRIGIGFYDFNTGQWLEIHQTQPNETVHLGHRYASDANNQIAIGFANTGLADPGWRVIVFDMATGQVVDQLRSDGSEIASFVGGEFLAGEYVLPDVLLMADDGGIHFRLDPLNEEDAPLGAMAWYPEGAPGVDQELISSPYTAIDIDLNPDGSAIYATHDASYPDGPENDAGVMTNTIWLIQAGVTSLYFADGVSRVYAPHLAADGTVLLFKRIGDDESSLYWIELGGSVLNPLPIPAALVLGVPDGFVFTSDDGVYFMSQSAIDPEGPLVSQTNLDLVWATTYGSPPLALDTPIAAAGSTAPLIVTATPREANPTLVSPVVATAAPDSTLCLADSQSAATINIRSGPSTDYAIIGEIAKGSPIQVTGMNGQWYVVNYAGLQGWVASWVTALSGNCGSVPFVPAPAAPPPTAVPPAGPTEVPGAAVINFWADNTSILIGNCTTVRWAVENILSVQFEGAGVVGNDSREVCPGSTTTYTLLVNLRDGTSTTRTVTVEVTAITVSSPDLYVSEFSLDPASPTKGQAVNVRVGVYNQGNAAASGNFQVEWYAGENYPSPACSWTVSGMAAHGGRILTCTYAGYPSHYPSINTLVKVDTTNAVAESDETNNAFRQAVTVNSP